MMRVVKSVFLFSLASTALWAGATLAAPCSLRPSDVVGGFGVGAVATGGTAVAATGAGMQAAGFYTLVHATSGATMLASTTGGVSAAGTVGIMGGTSGIVGATSGILMAPVTVVAGAVLAIGTVGWEGLCYFKDERVTDYVAVLAMMQEIAKTADPSLFQVAFPEGASGAWIYVSNSEGKFDAYNISNLYIVNGTLMNRDWLLNTTIGNIAFLVPATDTKDQ